MPDGWNGLAPKMASSSSVRPAPSSPATPKTSPACTLKEMSRKLGRPLPGVPGSESSLDLEQRVLADRVLARSSSESISRPTIQRTT